jgi:hypothetical protein
MMPSIPLRRVRSSAAAALAAMLAPAVSMAQLTSDQVPRARLVPLKQQVELQMEQSRLRLGPLRLFPSIDISQAGYDNNVLGTEEGGPEPIDDWLATVGAGISGIAPLGSKFYVRGSVLPKYTWYKELEERRNLGGFFDFGALAFFNRASAEARGYFSESVGIFNPESELQVREEIKGGSVKAEIDITRKLSAFGAAEGQRIDATLIGTPPEFFLDPSQLDRTESLGRGGLRFRFSPQFDVTVAGELTQTDFHNDPERDNRTAAVLAGIYYERPRLFVNLVGGYRSGRPFHGSSFREYDQPSGSVFLSFFPRPTVELQLFGGQRVVYSAVAEAPYFLETKGGAGLNVQVLRSLLLKAYAEYGVNDYDFLVPVDDVLIEPHDPFRVFGGGFSLKVFRRLVFSGNAYESEHRSNIPSQRRTVFRFVTSLSISGEFTR